MKYVHAISLFLAFFLFACTNGTLRTAGFGSINIEVPIEMVDSGISSSSASDTLFERTRTSLNMQNYDGTINSYFEIDAINNGAAPYNVDILDSSGSMKGSITIPNGTGTATRFRTSFFPNSGSDSYRVDVRMTAVNTQVVVYTARMLIQQQGATQTRLYIPLLGATYSSSNLSDIGGQVDTASTLAWTQTTPGYFPSWIKNSGSYSSISSWTLEVNAEDVSSIGGQVTLYDETTLNAVTSSTITVGSTGSILDLQQSISNSDPNFVDGHRYDLRMFGAPGSTPINIYKAGLWVSLNNLSKGEIYYRVGRSQSGIAPTQVYFQRALLNLSLFSNPSVYLETTSTMSVGGAYAALTDGLTNDASIAGGALLSSYINGPAGTPVQRSNEYSSSVISGDRFFAYLFPNGVATLYNATYVVIGFHN